MPKQTGNTDCGVFVCAYATLRQLNLESVLFDQTHNQPIRLYIANVILANQTLPLTQIDLKLIPPREETTGIIGQGQQVSTLGAQDERKRKHIDTDEDTVSKQRRTGASVTEARKRRKSRTNVTKEKDIMGASTFLADT